MRFSPSNLSVTFLKFFDLLWGEHIPVIHLDGGILLYPFTGYGLRNAVFLAGLGLCLTVLVKGNEELLKIFLVLYVVVCCRKSFLFCA